MRLDEQRPGSDLTAPVRPDGAGEALVRDPVWEDSGARAGEPLETAVRSLTPAGGGRLGGDAWSIASRGGETLILLADARGNGDHAAPLARALLAVFRALTKKSAAWDVARIGEALDDTVRAVGTEEDFATALLVHGTGRGALELLTCGHPAPVLLSPEGLRQIAVQPSLPLGLGSSPQVIQKESLGHEERLLLYTDGLTEGVDHSGRFRVEDHVEALHCEDLDVALDALLGRVMQHTGGVVHDDLTAMLIRRRGRGSRRRDAPATSVPEQSGPAAPPGPAVSPCAREAVIELL